MKINKRKFTRFVFHIAVCGLCLLGILWGFRYFSARAKQIDYSIQPEQQDADSAIDQYLSSTQRVTNQTSKSIPETLILINDENPVPDNYQVDLVDVGNGYTFDRKAAPHLKQMLSDARAAGLSPVLCSSYRTEEEQTLLFKDKVHRLMREGYTYQNAFDEAKRTVALPGRSEHNIGYAVDIVSTQYNKLDDGFAMTPEAIWLAENCHKYGFILRYPEHKTEITNIIYEPWHFRYVGINAATEIMEEDVCLEEYIEKKYNP